MKTSKTMEWVLLLLVGTSWLLGCKEDEKKPTAAQPSMTQQPPATTGGGSGTIDQPVSGPAKTLQQCNDAGTAWIAVVNGGQSPSTCGSNLSTWGCCKAAVVGRFPSLAKDLASRIDQNVTDGYQLYNCSSPQERAHKLHFARFPGDGKTEYREISIDAFAYDAPNPDNCPKIPDVDFPDPSQYFGSTGGGSSTPSPSPSSSSGGSGTALSFEDDINPIIKAECSASGCHGVAGAASVVYENNESNFKAGSTAIKDRIARAQGVAGVMPPSRALSAADRGMILEFLRN
jgi:hypothetical protein